MAGPCAVERLEMTVGIAHEVKAPERASCAAAPISRARRHIRSKAWAVRVWIIWSRRRNRPGLPVVSEIMDTRDIELFLEKADIIQIGARNMQNFELLKEVGAYDKPVLLKRGLSATIKEFLLSAEYIMSRGNRNVMLCERGIRTFETQYRNTLDLAAIPTLKELSHLPVIVDPSHATGKWNLVAPMSKAAVAAGADGILIEVHSNPECALCDGEESIKPSKFKELMHDMRKIAAAVGRELREVVNESPAISSARRSIIGVGLIGGSLGMILRRKQLASSVMGVGRRIENLKTAVERGRDRSLRRGFQRGGERCRPGRFGDASRYV